MSESLLVRNVEVVNPGESKKGAIALNSSGKIDFVRLVYKKENS